MSLKFNIAPSKEQSEEESSRMDVNYDLKQLKMATREQEEEETPREMIEIKKEEENLKVSRSPISNNIDSVLKSMSNSNLGFYENLHKRYFNKAKETKRSETVDFQEVDKLEDISQGHSKNTLSQHLNRSRDNSRSHKTLQNLPEVTFPTALTNRTNVQQKMESISSYSKSNNLTIN